MRVHVFSRAPSPLAARSFVAGIVISRAGSVQFSAANSPKRPISAHGFVGRDFASLKNVRLEKETFGPVLRAARERKGVTLTQLASKTKLSAELWAAIEDNNLARWPKRVFASSYMSVYADVV